MAKTKTDAARQVSEGPPKRVYVQQSMLPKRKLRDAMLIPKAIVEGYGKSAMPHQVAMAIDSSPTSSSWRDLTGAAIAYGLTEGGYNSDRITVTELGRRCIAPTEEGDDVKARSDAALHNTKTGLFVAVNNPEPSASISLEAPEPLRSRFKTQAGFL